MSFKRCPRIELIHCHEKVIAINIIVSHCYLQVLSRFSSNDPATRSSAWGGCPVVVVPTGRAPGAVGAGGFDLCHAQG